MLAVRASSGLRSNEVSGVSMLHFVKLVQTDILIFPR
jgi:hypothetical protein